MKKFLSPLLSLSILLSCILAQAAYSPGALPVGPGAVPSGALPAGQTFGIPGGPQFQTYEEFMQWQEAANKEIDQFVKTLSPEEQQQFFKDVEELTKVMSEMDPQDLEQWLKNVLPQEPMHIEGPVPAPAPTQEAPPAPRPEKTPEPEVPTKTTDALTKIIEDIISHTERFLRTSQMIPELPGKIEKWVSKNQVREWKADVSWEILKSRIEELNQKLHQIRDSDPKTKKPKYLAYLAEHESLKNNLSHLHETLKKYGPKVEAPAFGLGNVTKESRQAIKEVLSNFTEAIYKLDLIAELSKVIEKYEPRAKEFRETEEASRKKAHEESKRGRFESPKIEIGSPDYGMGGYSGGSNAYSPDYYGTPTGYDYGYPPATSTYTPYDTSYSPESSFPLEKPEGKSDKPTSSSAPKEEKPTKAPEVKEDAATKRSLNKIEKSIDEFASTIEKSKLINLQSHMNDASPVDQDLAAFVLPNAVRKLKNVIDQIKTLKMSLKKSNPSFEKTALEEVRAMASPHRDLFDNLSRQIKAVKRNPAASDEKLQAYKTALDELETAISSFNSEVGSYGTSRGSEDRTPIAPAREPRTSPRSPSAEDPGETEQPAVTRAPTASAQAPGVERLLTRIDTYLEQADRTMADSVYLPTIETHIKDTISQAQLGTVKAVQSGINDLKSAQRSVDSVKKLYQSLSTEQKKATKEQLKNLWSEHPLFDSLTAQIEAIKKLDPASLSVGKRYAYLKADIPDASFGVDAAARKAFNALKAVITEPASLLELSDVITKLKKSINDLA